MDKIANQVFEEIPLTEGCRPIIVDSEQVKDKGFRVYLSQLNAPAPGTRDIIEMDKDQARTLVEILQRAFEL